MPHRIDDSVEAMQKSIMLFRSLLSRIKTPQAESEIFRFVIDGIHSEFPMFRAAFSRIDNAGELEVVYSREPAGMKPLTGRRIPLGGIPGVIEALRRGETLVVADIRRDPRFAPGAEQILAFGGNLARIDVPFRASENEIYLLSLTHPEPREWERFTIVLLQELGELVALMLRESLTQEKLVRSESLFRQFAESVEVVFWMTDPAKNEMLYVSPAYEKIWGRSVQSLYANPLSFLEAVHQEDRPRLMAAILRQSEGQYTETFRIVRPDGQIRWIKDRGFCVHDAQGRVQRIVGIAEDITLLREAQDRLEETRAQVISNAKLAALGEMASGIAHEINNPLAVIHGHTKQLQEICSMHPDVPEMVKENLQTMEKMADRIKGIVKGLRTFSRQTTSDPYYAADLNAILQDTLAMCEARILAAGINLRVVVPATRTWIICRSSEISQVLLNLINNAFDAALPVPSAEIEVRIARTGKTATLSVENSGAPIPSEIRGRIFQPFFTTKGVGRGTGLGLSISKGIADAHGGRLFLDERSSRTCFTLELPAEEEGG